MAPWPMHASAGRDWIRHPASEVKSLRRQVPNGLFGAGHERRWLNQARFAMVRRDGSRCALCSADYSELVAEWLSDPTNFFPLTLDHIEPLRNDGEHSLANMQLLCTRCHRVKTGAEARARKQTRSEVNK